MRSYYITFRSVTFAQQGEGALRHGGVECVLQRTPRWMEKQGCGYCLRIRAQDAPKALELLHAGQVQFRKVYLQLPGGEVEEVTV